jgi:mannose-1-phosphate guanylyltransferase
MVMEAEYRVNQVTVRPGENLAPCLHYHRHEHWVVLAGVAEVTIDGRAEVVTADESIHIPPGRTYRLANFGQEDLLLLEIRSGEYVGDDDRVELAS